jgi:hypothetical protein
METSIGSSALDVLLTLCAATGDPQPFGAYEIRRRQDGHAIGAVGFHRPPDENGIVTIGGRAIYARVPVAGDRRSAAERRTR